MKRIFIFLALLWRVDPQYGFLDSGLAWELSGVLYEFDEELSTWEELR